MAASAFVWPHALVDDEVYTVVKGDPSHFPHIPPRFIYNPESLLIPNFSFGWVFSDLPFMPFTPKYWPFQWPLFHHLDFNDRNLPIARVQAGVFALDERVAMEWYSLERNLRAVIFAMGDKAGGAITKYFRLWTYPHRYGYKNAYPTRLIARNAASRARDAFVPLMAAVTYLFFYMDQLESRVPSFNWRDGVLQKTGVHPEWLALLENSTAGDRNLQRIGGIIDISDPDLRPLISFFCEASMPVIIYWPPNYDVLSYTQTFLTSRKLVPIQSQINNLRHVASLPLPHPRVPSPPATDTGHGNISTAALYPPVDKFSGQKPGEHWLKFFSRREAADVRKLGRETPSERASRIAREKHAEKQSCPGKKGARVYIWEDVDNFRVRRAAGRSHYEDLWTDYGPRQRRYDSFRDEWDMCTEFDPTDGPDYRDFEETYSNDGVQENEDLPQALLPEISDTSDHREGVYSTTAALNREHAELLTEDNLDMLTDRLEDKAYSRFGFVQPYEPAIVQPRTPWSLAREFLGNGRWLGPSPAEPSVQTQQNICSFFDSLLASRSLFDIPADIIDLRQDGIFPNPLPIRIRIQKLDKDIYYLLRPNTDDIVDPAPMELGLRSAVTVMEIIRAELGPDLPSLISWLADQCIPFKTFIRAPNKTLKPLPAPLFSGLGYRPPRYKPDLVDYRSYVFIRDRLLQSPRGRAAVAVGGIVARLAREAVRPSDIISGPSDDVYEYGASIRDQQPNSLAYWDDQLTKDELDIICGVYKIGTGSRQSEGEQTSDVSWWPKPSSWERSGLWVGYWSESCEKWYQKRLDQCRSGTAELRDTTGWKASIKFSRAVLKTTAINEERSAEYLASHFP